MLDLMAQLFPVDLNYFLLLFLRVSGLIFSSPVFGSRRVPALAKIGFCLVVANILYACLPRETLEFSHSFEYLFMCIKELAFGLILGFVTTAFLNLVLTSGQIIDMQMGFGMSGVTDAQSDIQVPVVGNFLSVALIIAFFGMNGHLRLIDIIRSTVQQIPLGQVQISPNIGYAAMEVFALSFVLAVNVAMPVIAASLLTEMAMGVLIRTVPQMNVFVVGIPVKIIVGLLMLLVMMPVFVAFTGTIFNNMFSSIEQLFINLTGAT